MSRIEFKSQNLFGVFLKITLFKLYSLVYTVGVEKQNSKKKFVNTKSNYHYQCSLIKTDAIFAAMYKQNLLNF